MRADMAKVIVERPRHKGWAWTKPKGYRRKERKLGSEMPGREGMKLRWKSGTKSLNEHLGPLRRFLEGQVGRPWDKVFSEICAHINRNSAVQDHVRDHVFDFVAVNVILVDGVPCTGDAHYGSYGRPLHQWPGWRCFYVCPRTGLLKKVKQPHQSKPQRRPTPAPVQVNESRVCLFVEGAWQLVSVRRFPEEGAGKAGQVFAEYFDSVLNRPLTRAQAIKAYGAPVYAVAKRRLRKTEMRQLPIPIDQQRL